MSHEHEHSDQRAPGTSGFAGISEDEVSLPRVPRLHIPYLILMGLAGVACAAQPFVVLSDTVVGGFALLLLGAAIVHVIWLSLLFRDSRQLLGAAVPLTPGRIVLTSTLACFLLPLWTALVLVILLRTVHRIASRTDPTDGLRLAPFAADATGLVLAALAGFGGLALAIAPPQRHIALYGQGRFEPFSLQDVMGTAGATVLSLFALATFAYYVHFLARAVPVLYQSYRVIIRAQEGG